MRRRRKGSFWSRLDFGTQPTTNKFPSSNPHDPTACTRGPCDWDPERSRTDKSLAGRPQPTCCRRRGPGLRPSHLPTGGWGAGAPASRRHVRRARGDSAVRILDGVHLHATATASRSGASAEPSERGRQRHPPACANGARGPATPSRACFRLLLRFPAGGIIYCRGHMFHVPFFLLLTIATNKLCCPSTMLFTVQLKLEALFHETCGPFVCLIHNMIIMFSNSLVYCIYGH